MNLALTCWERGPGKPRLDLAVESRTCPLYIDESTTITSTLDEYLKLGVCPKKSRSKRVVDTAEFVLRKVGDNSSSACEKLQAELNSFRKRLPGV